jgi:hypothetical protein
LVPARRKSRSQVEQPGALAIKFSQDAVYVQGTGFDGFQNILSHPKFFKRRRRATGSLSTHGTQFVELVRDPENVRDLCNIPIDVAIGSRLLRDS